MSKPTPKLERLPWSRLFFLLLVGGLLMMMGSLVRPGDAQALADLGRQAAHERAIRTDAQIASDTAARMHWTNWVEFIGFATAAASVVLAAGKTAISKKP
jgi:hypothetical protein